MLRIHPTAVIESGARIADDARVGPFCVVGPEVALGAGVVLGPHVVVTGRTTLGEGVTVGAGAALGGPPQHARHEGPAGALRIGARCTLREHVTVHAGSSVGGMLTELGEGCVLMVGAHVGHDGRLGPRCTLVNGAMLGGHVDLGEGVFVGGASTVHQFVRLGAHAYIGGSSAVERDVVPWGLAWGNRAVLRGPNLVGMERAGMGKDARRAARTLFDRLFGPGTTPLAARVAAVDGETSEEGSVRGEVLAFLRAPSVRGVLGRLAVPRSGS